MVKRDFTSTVLRIIIGFCLIFLSLFLSGHLVIDLFSVSGLIILIGGILDLLRDKGVKLPNGMTRLIAGTILIVLNIDLKNRSLPLSWTLCLGILLIYSSFYALLRSERFPFLAINAWKKSIGLFRSKRAGSKTNRP